jgi:hypothetical protein
VYAALLAALVVLAVVLRAVELDGPSGFDEGIYASGLLLVHDGLIPQRDFFHAQGPLFLFSLIPAYLLGGETLTAARAGAAAWSLIGLAGLGLAGWMSAGRSGALCVVAAGTLSTDYLAVSRSALAEAPAIGLSCAAVGAATVYYSRGQRFWLVASALLLTCAVLVKVLVISSVVPVAILVLVGRVGSIRHRIRDAAVASAPALLLTAAIALLCDPASVWQQAVGYHMQLTEAYPLSVSRNVELFRQFGGVELAALAVFGLVGILMLTRKRPALAAAYGSWALVTAALLVTHSPLFARHLTAVVPALALACAGLGLLADGPRGRLGVGVLATGILAAAIVSWSGLWTATLPMPRQPMLEEAIVALGQLTSDSDTVVTDHAVIPFMAHRALTPPLADLSRARVQSGNLSDGSLKDTIHTWRPAAILWWFGYVRDAYPRLHDDLMDNYTPVWSTEDGRTLAILGDGHNLPAEFLDGYRPAGRPTFGESLLLQSVKHAGTSRAGANLEVRLLWNVLERPAGDWSAVITVRRNTGAEAGRAAARLGEGWGPTMRWQPQTVAASYLKIPLQRDASGSFRVFLQLVGGDGSPVSAKGSRVRDGVSTEISNLTVEPA